MNTWIGDILITYTFLNSRNLGSDWKFRPRSGSSSKYLSICRHKQKISNHSRRTTLGLLNDWFLWLGRQAIHKLPHFHLIPWIHSSFLYNLCMISFKKILKKNYTSLREIRLNSPSVLISFTSFFVYFNLAWNEEPAIQDGSVQVLELIRI